MPPPGSHPASSSWVTVLTRLCLLYLSIYSDTGRGRNVMPQGIPWVPNTPPPHVYHQPCASRRAGAVIPAGSVPLRLVVCWQEESLPPGLFLRDPVGRITSFLLLPRSPWLKGRHPTSAPPSRGRPPPPWYPLMGAFLGFLEKVTKDFYMSAM